MTNSLEDVTPGRPNESTANASNVHQILALIIPNDQRIEAMRSRYVAAYDELLAPIYAVLYPRAGSFSSLIQAVLAPSDNTFQLLLPERGDHVVRCGVELFSDANVT